MIRSEQSCHQAVEDIRKDNVSGASEISRKAASAFALFAAESHNRSASEFFGGLLRLGADLVLAQPHMASVFNLVNSVLYSIEQSQQLCTPQS